MIYLAGPAVNLGLWLGLDALAGEAVQGSSPMLALPLAVLASANFFLMIFNLLPAYPLDGGHTLDAWLGALLGPRVVGAHRRHARPGGGRRRRALRLADRHLPAAVALFLAQANWQALQSVGGWRR